MPRKPWSPVDFSLRPEMYAGKRVSYRKQRKDLGDPEETPAQERSDPPVGPRPGPLTQLCTRANDLHLASLSSLCLPSASCKAQGDRSPRLGLPGEDVLASVMDTPAVWSIILLETQGEHGRVGSPWPAPAPGVAHPELRVLPTADAGVGGMGTRCKHVV